MITGVVMSALEWRRVPVGLDAGRWVTRTGCRIVLVVVHTVTSGQRLMDVAGLLGPDLRIQVIFTVAPDVFSEGVSDFLRAVGGIVVPWLQATQLEFDLALAASYGSIHELHAPLIVLPHGAGFGKLAARQPGHRAVAARGAYGLDAQRLVRDGCVIPAAIVLPHDADLARLAGTCPEALPVASVAGDPCFDLLLASAAERPAYRRSLAVGEGQKLVVVTSTWGPQSLFGQAEALLPRLLAELPRNQFCVVALLHPNVWYGHGTWQVRAWLAACLRRGLGLIPPEADWRAALAAADLIVADHGSLGVYGTVVKVPLMLAGFPAQEVDPGSASAALAKAAPRLYPDRPLIGQLSKAAAAYCPSRYEQVTARITSQPGRFDRNMRRLMYGLLRLSQPAVISPPPVAAPPSLIS
jgi:hypothetical protein